MGDEFRYLLLSRFRVWRAVVDGSELSLPDEGRDAALAEIFRERVAPQLRERRRRAAEAFAEFSGQVTVTSRRILVGNAGNEEPRSVSEIVLGDGTVLQCSPGTEQRRIAEEFQARFGPVEIAWNEAQELERWMAEPGRCTERRGWHLTRFDPSGATTVEEVGAISGDGGVPLHAIVLELNQLGALGWEVVSVNEDKGLYRGTDALDESFPSRIRYLLRRRGPTHPT